MRKSLLTLATVSVILLVAVFVYQNYTKEVYASWYSASWSYRRPIEIVASKVGTTTAVTGFPVLVSSTLADWKYTSHGGKMGKTDGTDIVFTLSDGTTKLDHEIEKYSSSTGEMIVWIEYSGTLSTTSTTTIYSYYGNSGASDQQNATGVWDSSYRGVWHSASTTGTTLSDSTSNALNGTKLSATEPNPATGFIAGAQDYDGVNDYVTISDVNNPTAYTLSAWVKKDSLDNESIFVRTDSSGPTNSWSHQLRTDTTGSNPVFNSYFYDGSLRDLIGNTVYSTSSWFHISAVAQNSTTGGHKLYVNGVQQTNTTDVATLWTGGDRWRVGEQSGASRGWYDGIIDELRYSTAVRPQSWILTEYNNQSATSTFYWLGAEEQDSVTPTTTVGKTTINGANGSVIISGSGVVIE